MNNDHELPPDLLNKSKYLMRDKEPLLKALKTGKYL